MLDNLQSRFPYLAASFGVFLGGLVPFPHGFLPLLSSLLPKIHNPFYSLDQMILPRFDLGSIRDAP